MAATEEALAVAMLRDQFGNVVAETARILLANPASTLKQVFHHAKEFCKQMKLEGTEKERDRVRVKMFRDAIAVLMQHGIAQAVERTAEGTGKGNLPKETYTVYYLRTGDALFRVRVPLYMGFVRRRFGDVGVEAVTALFNRGKLTAKQLMDVMRKGVVAGLDISEIDVEACLTDMAKSGVMKHAGKRYYKDSKDAGKDSDDDDEPIHRVGTKRPRSPDDEKTNGEGQDIAVGRGHHRVIVGAPSTDNDNDLWIVCYWHLNREFRNQCCSMIAAHHVGIELSQRIFKVGLGIALDAEDCEAPSDDFETVEVDTDAIQKALAEKDEGLVNSHEFWDAVQALTQQSPQFVIPIPENAPTKLRFIPGRLMSELRQRTLEELILSRYTQIGRRVFKALAIDGGMEEKTVAQKCMLPLKVVREYLFKMYHDRLVAVQEVPRSHDQTRASNWYYLWKVNAMMAYRKMTEVMYKTSLNLFLRLESLEKSSANGDGKKVEQQRELLRLSIIRMDQSIMVMRDCGPITAAYLPVKYRVVDGPIKAKKRRS